MNKELSNRKSQAKAVGTRSLRTCCYSRQEPTLLNPECGMAVGVPPGLAVPCLAFFGVLRHGQRLVHELIRQAGGAGRERQSGSYLLLSFQKFFYPEDKNLGEQKKRKSPSSSSSSSAELEE